ncbi:MAG: PilN domain-containing protein, partial [Oceanidesulfovibrio sp.]
EGQATPRAKLVRLLKAWGGVPAKDVILVTTEFHSILADLPRPSGKRLTPEGEQMLLAAGRFEIASYLDYPAEEAMLAILRLPETEEAEVFADAGEPARFPALLFALNGRSYQQLKALCAALKMRLRGVAPEESFAFASQGDSCPMFKGCLLDDGLEDAEVSVLMNMLDSHGMGALLVNGKAAAFARYDFGGEEDTAEGVAALTDELGRLLPPGLDRPPSGILVGGKRVEEETAEALAPASLPAPLRIWDAASDLDVECPGPLPRRYMAELGAAAQYVSRSEHLIVDDHIPIKTRVVRHPLSGPILTLVVFGLLVFVDYEFKKHKVVALETTIAALQEDKTALEEKAKSGSGMMEQYESLKDEKNELEREIELLTQGLRNREVLQCALFAGLASRTPLQIQLRRVSQFSESAWRVEGAALRYTDITTFVVDLKALPMVEQCRLESSSEQPAKDGAISTTYTFTLRLRLRKV